MKIKSFLILLAALSMLACDKQQVQSPPPAQSAASVDHQRLLQAAEDSANWITHGRDYSEQRFSPLTAINDSNVNELSVAWATLLGSYRGIEATPLVVDGVMYTTGSWSIVTALDARSGEVMWVHDPAVPREKGAHACCDVVNRGVAVHQGKVFVGTIDGRLLSLDAATGQEVWSRQTVDASKPYTITGAPRVINGKVIIGNGGAEFGVRGFVAAYDVDTGEQVWKFFTVPGNPEDGFENPTMEMAAKTWKGEWWALGGGGTVWDSMAYDPELDLLYIGVGNGSPWNQKMRSPGGGDNLFLSSIVALRPDTGEYVWHYQTTPGETWDYTATQHILLADIELDGVERKVLMQAPKNGFFYVIDRQTGALISAENFVPVNWATHIDLASGRPVEVPGARFEDGPALVFPSPFGGHNWHPMSFSPITGLVYLPAQEIPQLYKDSEELPNNPNVYNTGIDWAPVEVPDTSAERRALNREMMRGVLLAWDPRAQKARWRVDYETPWNGGTLATAGNLVFQGRSDDSFAAMQADTGEVLWSIPVGTGIVAGPISYEVEGEQYIAVSAGWGSVLAAAGGEIVDRKPYRTEGKMIAFKVGGKRSLEVKAYTPPATPEPPALNATPERLELGRNGYASYCGNCHGGSAISGALAPDLRASRALYDESWFRVVLDGERAANGMISYSEVIDRDEAGAIRDYVISRAWAAYRDENPAQKTPD